MRNGFRRSHRGISVLSVLLAVVAFPLSVGAKQGKARYTAEYRAGELVVKLKGNSLSAKSLQAQRQVLLKSLAPWGVTAITPLKMDARYLKVVARGTMSMGSLVDRIAANPAVEYAEPNFVYHTMDGVSPLNAVLKGIESRDTDLTGQMPNDPNFGLDWGLLNTGQNDSGGQAGTPGVDIAATKAWELGQGSRDIVVAVIDTGIDYNHEDLAPNVWTDPVDHSHGHNFDGGNNDPMDDNRHGTHCSGTIGAVGDNSTGTAGVNWKVSIMGVKFLSSQGSGSLSDAVDSIKFATSKHVNIMSNSWGGGGYSKAMEDAIKEARDAGILFVAAAGNESNDNDARAGYPATYQVDNVISVAATDNKDVMASWSNRGARTVHLAAPGVKIYSTIPGNKYEVLSGTSMATPHVSGAAALLWSLNPKMTYKEIKARLLATVDPVPALRGKMVTGGRLNINNAVRNIVPPRSMPDSDSWVAIAQTYESEHNYDNNADTSVVVQQPGVRYLRVHFSRINVEASYDSVKILDASGAEIESLTGDLNDHTSQYVEGDTLTVNLKSDASETGWGWEIDRVEYVQ